MEAVTAKDVRSRAMMNLFEQIRRGGGALPLALMLAAFSLEDVLKVRVRRYRVRRTSTDVLPVSGGRQAPRAPSTDAL